ncbi:hypothetical protein B0J14DRAFT_702091 [Halenospora varia]|nr:hypothetical protein B0J14DRAFT_702091 [Halenospora varia]
MSVANQILYGLIVLCIAFALLTAFLTSGPASQSQVAVAAPSSPSPAPLPVFVASAQSGISISPIKRELPVTQAPLVGKLTQVSISMAGNHLRQNNFETVMDDLTVAFAAWKPITLVRFKRHEMFPRFIDSEYREFEVEHDDPFEPTHTQTSTPHIRGKKWIETNTDGTKRFCKSTGILKTPHKRPFKNLLCLARDERWKKIRAEDSDDLVLGNWKAVVAWLTTTRTPKFFKALGSPLKWQDRNPPRIFCALGSNAFDNTKVLEDLGCSEEEQHKPKPRIDATFTTYP